jgi:hypothetical protein
MSRALTELDRQDRRGPARKPSIRGRRFLGRGELAFLVSIPVIAAVLYVLTQQFPALLGPAPGPVLRDPAPMGTGPYAFMATTSGGQPVTYSSCRPINYVVNPAGMPAGGHQLIQDAITQVSQATGLQFVYQGESTEPPSEHREIHQPDRYSSSTAPVLIAWANTAEYPPISGDVEGVGGSAWIEPSRGPAFYVTGQVVLSRDGISRMMDRSGGYERARAVLLHEFGHLVGLAHVQDPKELMTPVVSGLTGYGPGDRTGLARLGHGPCIRGR